VGNLALSLSFLIKRGGAESIFVIAGVGAAIVDVIEGLGSCVFGFGFWRFGRGDEGGEVVVVVVIVEFGN
jgi:hypothetical protein